MVRAHCQLRFEGEVLSSDLAGAQLPTCMQEGEAGKQLAECLSWMSRHTHERPPWLCRWRPSAQNRSALSSAALKGSTAQAKGGTGFMTQKRTVVSRAAHTAPGSAFPRKCLKQMNFNEVCLACQ